MQTRVHVEDGVRLNTFIKAMEAAGVTVAVSADRLDAESLGGVDVVLIPTRMAVDGNEYSPNELTALERFTAEGGGLLLMSNHGDLPGRNKWDHTRHDRVLAARFDVDVQPAWFKTGEWDDGTLTKFDGDLLNADHPVFAVTDPHRAVRTVVTNNCSAILRGAGAPLVSLAPAVVDWRNGLAVSEHLFGRALETTSARRGRVVVLADSGFIGSAGTTRPGPGLIEHGDNLRFVWNTIAWLGAASEALGSPGPAL
ncbi:MAG: hypothetical protein M3P30_12170 [Chloroflexota bacterium]|nr:hypothetical protein [Chloroflexota bacterium]